MKGPSVHQNQWPRCRWCHLEIKPNENTTTGPRNRSVTITTWLHIESGERKCKGRENFAEPISDPEEQPFITGVWAFVDKYRKLRREFREVCQERASLKRRLDDWHVLIDELVKAYHPLTSAALDVGLTEDDKRRLHPAIYLAIEKIKQYRYEKKAAGWR